MSVTPAASHTLVCAVREPGSRRELPDQRRQVVGIIGAGDPQTMTARQVDGHLPMTTRRPRPVAHRFNDLNRQKQIRIFFVSNGLEPRIFQPIKDLVRVHIVPTRNLSD